MTLIENGLAAHSDAFPEDERRYATALERLVGVVQQLSLARNIETITTIVRRAARSLTGADGATFVLRDQDKCYYVDEDAIEPLWKGQRFDMDACVSGWAMLNGQSAIIEDIYNDARVPADVYRPTFVKSLVTVPVRREAPIAAIGNYWATLHRPTSGEVAILQALADTTAVALENLELYLRLQEQLRLLQSQQARIGEQCDALALFTRAMAHDLREPLRSILSYSRIIEEETPLSGDSAQYFGYVRAGAERMALLIDGVYRYTALDALDRALVSPCDVASILAEVQHSLSPLIAGRNVRLQMECNAQLLAVPAHMDQLWSNLVRNAIVHNRQGVTVTAGTVSRDGRMLFYVGDDGAGIAGEDTGQIFVPFRRMTHRPDCAGLGLALCRRIVNLYGGDIWFEPAVSGGATFLFTLPDAEVAPLGGIGDKLAHLMIVDDREDDIELAERCLVRRPNMRCDISYMRDGKEALVALAEEGNRPVDLMLLDINMPRMNGFELLKRMREHDRLRSVNVIMCSGSDYAPDRLRAQELGAIGYITKPPIFGQFAEVIDRVPGLSLVRNEKENLLLKVAA